MSSSLPPRPNLEWLRKSAKARLVRLRETQPDARLSDAQLAIAREYGFPSWRRLKAHVDRVASRAGTPVDERLVADFLRAAGTGRIDDVRAQLAETPSLVNAVGPHPFWGGRPQALHVAIEANRGEVFDLLLKAGADVDGSNTLYDHWSPLMLAIHRDRANMRDELMRRGARVGLVEALMLGDDGRVDALLRAGLPAGDFPNGGFLLRSRAHRSRSTASSRSRRRQSCPMSGGRKPPKRSAGSPRAGAS